MVARSYLRLDLDHLAYPGPGVTAIGRLATGRSVSAVKRGRPGSVPWLIEARTVEKAQIGRVGLGQNV